MSRRPITLGSIVGLTLELIDIYPDAATRGRGVVVRTVADWRGDVHLVSWDNGELTETHARYLVEL